MCTKKRCFEKAKTEGKTVSPTFDDTFCAISIRQMQTAFCLLVVGYVLAVVCFVTEILCQYCRINRREHTSSSLCYWPAETDTADKII
jgi:hypothetical protein